MNQTAESGSGGGRAGRSDPIEVRICGGSGCVAQGALEVLEALRRAIDDAGLSVDVDPRPGVVGCRGFCSQGPLLHIPDSDLLYCRVVADDVSEIVSRTLGRGEAIERLLYDDRAAGRRYRGLADNPFFSRQDRQVLARCGVVDPDDLDHAEALGAYEGLRHSLMDLDPGRVTDLVKRSGLQERGGVGFPVGLKWAVVAETPGDRRYVIGNGVGGDPGLTVDRTLIESDPHRIIEGMIIAGFAVGACHGRCFLRSEHALGVARIERAVAEARRRGYLGVGILGTGFDFEIEVCENAGASMGGEETAMLNAIQGRRGAARPRPPFPAVSGLWGRPTLINSLETLANIPLILGAGAEPVERPPGRTRVVGVSGAVARPGLVEVALGTSIREVVDEIAGGGRDGEIRTVHLGGYGGATLGRDEFDTTFDFGALRDQGAHLGSGGLVALGEKSCPIALARFFVATCAEESCGTCPPCRIGTSVVLNLLDRIASGDAEPSDLERLEGLCRHISRTSMCELGRNATRSVVSGLSNHREVYEAHLSGGCPGGVCPPAGASGDVGSF